eukprot:TRINITY_DN3241_c0_g1_i1.p1 TRINITY_DN3241_c0_g1~~TRINITY_DN3241_c0_g1_i1.p1  ORF type:complete len:192 (-),score=45.76 TRINITY_DN3241_c0_g1_i1:189-731(-)
MEGYHLSMFGHQWGKTALLFRFCYGAWTEPPHRNEPLYGHMKWTWLGEKTLILLIDETPTDETYIPEETTGFIFGYSINSQASFQSVPTFYKEVLSLKNAEKLPSVLVGMKSDLEDQRQVSEEEGKALALWMGCPFFECSALTDHNVAKPFFQLVTEIKKQRTTKPKKNSFLRFWRSNFI